MDEMRHRSLLGRSIKGTVAKCWRRRLPITRSWWGRIGEEVVGRGAVFDGQVDLWVALREQEY
jgi:hypothetical protein